MKKTALLLLLALLLIAMLTACNQAATTYASPRWENEKYTFHISKANFTTNSIEHDGNTFIVEPAVSGYELLPEKLDQVVPEDVSGTFTTDLVVDDKTQQCTYTTNQVLYCQYKTDELQSYAKWDELKQFVVATDSKENPFSNHDGLTTMKSVTDTKVVFLNKAAQTPVYSENKVDGFYIGKVEQTVSKYEYKTEYTYDEKGKLAIKVNGEVVKPVGSYAAAKLIDANQLLLYVRSLEKGADKFADSPTVYTYSAVTNTASTVSFAFTYECKTVLDQNGTQIFVNVNAVGVVIDSAALLTQLNVPGTVNKDKALDFIPNISNKVDKYTMLKFRSGFLKYEMNDFNQMKNGAEIIEAIQVKPASSK